MATIDRREAILSRVFALLQATPGVATDPYTGAACVYRDRDQLPDELRPGILLIDADEEADQQARDMTGRPGRAPNIVWIKPEIYVLLKVTKPQNLGTGTNLNTFRTAIVKAIMNDSVSPDAGTLRALCGSNGEVWYHGCITDLARGRTMLGEMGIAFWFRYTLHPSEL
jgi:hypothetical protein